VWIRRLGEERLLSRGERDIGWRKDPRPRPRHLGDAILVEQSPALVVGSPWGCSVHHRLGKQYDRPRRYVRNDHAGGFFRRLVDLARQFEVTLVTPGNAPESPRCRSGIGKIPGHDREPLVDAVRSKVIALSWLRGSRRDGPAVDDLLSRKPPRGAVWRIARASPRVVIPAAPSQNLAPQLTP